MTIKIHFDGLR